MIHIFITCPTTFKRGLIWLRKIVQTHNRTMKKNTRIWTVTCQMNNVITERRIFAINGRQTNSSFRTITQPRFLFNDANEIVRFVSAMCSLCKSSMWSFLCAIYAKMRFYGEMGEGFRRWYSSQGCIIDPMQLEFIMQKWNGFSNDVCHFKGCVDCAKMTILYLMTWL